MKEHNGFFHMPFKGTQLWSIWFIDMNGVEDNFTIRLSHKQAEALTEEMERRKTISDNQSISDYLLHKNDPYNYSEAMEYISDKLQEFDEESA